MRKRFGNIIKWKHKTHIHNSAITCDFSTNNIVKYRRLWEPAQMVDNFIFNQLQLSVVYILLIGR